MAEKIALHTGINDAWLLDPKRELPPTCERDPRRPYSKDVFDMRRAEVLAARSKPLDVRAIQNFLAVAYRQLNDAGVQDYYDTNKIIYFNFFLREFLEKLEQRWPDSGRINKSMDVAQIATEAAALFENIRQTRVVQS